METKSQRRSSVSEKSQKRLIIQQMLLDSADFFSFYLPFANAHPVDFIVKDIWNCILPENIQRELSTMTEEELYHLPSHQTISADSGQQLLSMQEFAKKAHNKCDELPSDLEKVRLQAKNESCSKVDNLSNSRNQCIQWKQGTVLDFIREVKKRCIEYSHCLDTSVEALNIWLLDKDELQSYTLPFVHAFMNEKKMHEVEIMADICTRIFHKASADVVVDLGSGKGYLTTHLSLQCQLPVLGIDSQPQNTAGASRRAEKLGRQWDSLVKNEHKRSKGRKSKISETETHTVTGHCSNDSTIWQDNNSKLNDELCAPDSSDCQKVEAVLGADSFCVEEEKISKYSEKTYMKPKEDIIIQTKKAESAVELKSAKKQSIKTEALDAVSLREYEPWDSNPKEKSDNPTESKNLSTKCVALTTFINADSKLVDFLEASADVLCPEKNPKDLRLFLTGLHTCGPLAPSMLRLFVKDSSVQAMCGVGCCYQLMQERFTDETGYWPGPQRVQNSMGCYDGESHEEKEGDFPLSSVLLGKQMAIGRPALNLASLSLPRMSVSDEELQGKTFYPRALLQAFIHKKLGYIPQDLKKLRKLAKRASSPSDYILRAIRKLNISGCEATEEEVADFHEAHKDQEDKMAAFYQLRAVLAPLVETIILLDRLLFLVEQDCVEDAFLFRLFDPVTSPRCHALIATKKQHHS